MLNFSANCLAVTDKIILLTAQPENNPNNSTAKHKTTTDPILWHYSHNIQYRMEIIHDPLSVILSALSVKTWP